MSVKRTAREIRHLLDLVGGMLVVPSIGGIMGTCLLLLVHHFVLPIPMIADIFSHFDSDPVVWEANIETGSSGDLGREYDQWSAKRGHAEDTSRFWQEFLWKHWLLLAGLASVTVVGLAVFYVRYFTYVVREYAAGVFRRADGYRAYDEAKGPERTVPSGLQSGPSAWTPQD